MIHRCGGWHRSGPERWSVLLLAVCCGSTGALGEERATAKSERHPIFSDTGPASAGPVTAYPQPGSASSAAGVSPRVRSLLKARLPAYAPVRPVDHADTPTDAIKLPPVLVTAPKLKVPDDAQSLSRDEFAALLRKRYPGASVPGQDPYRIEHGMPNYARLQYENDRRTSQMASFETFADLLEHTGNHKGGQQLKKEIQRAFGGTYKDPLMDAMDKSANGGRR